MVSQKKPSARRLSLTAINVDDWPGFVCSGTLEGALASSSATFSWHKPSHLHGCPGTTWWLSTGELVGFCQVTIPMTE